MKKEEIEKIFKNKISESTSLFFQSIDLDNLNRMHHLCGYTPTDYTFNTLANKNYYMMKNEIDYADYLIVSVVMDSFLEVFKQYGYPVTPIKQDHLFIVTIEGDKTLFWNKKSFKDWEDIAKENGVKNVKVIDFGFVFDSDKKNYPDPTTKIQIQRCDLHDLAVWYFDEWVSEIAWKCIYLLEKRIREAISFITVDTPSASKAFWFNKETFWKVSHQTQNSENMDYSYLEKNEQYNELAWKYISILDCGDKYVLSINDEFNVSQKAQDEMKNQFLNNEYINVLFGDSNFSKSFFSSEWLYRSLDESGLFDSREVKLGQHNKVKTDNAEFDYTSIVCGYLKSIEQLIFLLMQGLINQDYVVYAKQFGNKIPSDLYIPKGKDEDDQIRTPIRKILQERKEKKREKEEWEKKNENRKKIQKYVRLTDEGIKYVKTELGISELFLCKQNAKGKNVLNVDDDTLAIIFKAIDDFRDKCRNGNFHIDNVYNWDIVKTIRHNTLVLYLYILGSCNIDLENSAFCIQQKTDYDLLCECLIDNYYPEKLIVEMNGEKRDAILGIHPIPSYNHRTVRIDNIPLTIVEYIDEWEYVKKETIILSENNMPDRLYEKVRFKDDILLWEKHS